TGLTLGNDYIVAARPDWETNPIEKPDNAVGDEVNFILEANAGFTLEGVVKDEAGDPVSDVRVEAWSEALEIRGELWSATDRNGKYEFTGLLEATDYRLLLHPPDDSGLAFHQEEGVTVAGDLELDEIVLQSAGAIEGRVVDGVESAALKGVVVAAASATNSFYADAVTDNDGKYIITGVPNGFKYDVTARAASYIGRTIRDQAPETGVDFALFGSAAIRGVVRNKISGEAISGARVEARSATRQNNRGYSGVGFTDAAGVYEITGLMTMDPAGNSVDDYVITAQADGWPAASAGGRSAREEIDFSLARGPENRLAGAIENAAGGDVIVDVYDGSGFVTWTAAAEGEFEFTDLAPDGEYFLRFTCYEGDVEAKVQWASASGSVDYDIGTPDVTGDATPTAAKRYTPGGPPVHFRFSDAALAHGRQAGKMKDRYSLIGKWKKVLIGKDERALIVNGEMKKSVNRETNYQSRPLLPYSGYGKASNIQKPAQHDTASNFQSRAPYSGYEKATNIQKSTPHDTAPNYQSWPLLHYSGYEMASNLQKPSRHDTAPNFQSWAPKASNIRKPTRSDTATNHQSWTGITSTSHAGAVSNNPRVTVNWSPTTPGADEGYYYTFNQDPDHVITKRNAPGTRPGRTWTTTSNELTGDDVLYYFHIAAVDDRGRIGETARRGYRIDTVAPSNGRVIGPETTTGANITLFLGADSGVKEARLSNLGYGMGAAWETRTKTRAWRLSDGEGEKRVYVQYRDLAGNTANYMMSTILDPAGPDGFSLPDQTFAIAENSPAGSPAGVLLVSGFDPAFPLAYTLTAGDANHAFHLDAETGEITVNDARLLDYETMPVYMLSIRVENGENSDEAYITINITDVDEGELTIHDQIFPLPENSVNGVIVGTVAASGPAPITYEILSGNEDGAFALNAATGALTVYDAGRLDYETTPVYSLRVQVSDGENAPEADITINITDVDENELTLHAQTLHLSENSAAGAVVGIVTASGQGSFTYEILSGNMNDVFAIDPDTGEITVNDAGQLSYDATPVYILQVRATDGEEAAAAYITVNVFESVGTWTARWQNPRPAGNTLTSVWVYAPGKFFAAGDSGTIVHYDGATWTAMDAGTSADIHDIGGRPAENGGGPEVYAVGENGLILRWNGQYDGECWTAMDSGVAEDLNGLWASPGESDLFAVGDYGTILHHDGVEWTAMDSNTDQDLYDIVGYSASDLFA
ncbi:MAG: hypothetical protein GY859_15450, partial [Desulfobacterales bacterium]|nr:hypothetical protein [Desulfobacterales bacterium]